MSSYTWKGQHIEVQVVSRIWVIEFQKRGLPHCHMLLCLDPADKPRTPADIDQIVCAELPDPDTQPALWQVVTNCMVHGPCGPKCLKDGKCSKKYPRPWQPETSVENDGYPIYRRRDNGRVFQKGVTTFSNRDVVPYNPYLSARYECHINVEVCTSITAVKYLFKYVYKGHDRANVAVCPVGTDTDEVQAYEDARYVAASEGE